MDNNFYKLIYHRAKEVQPQIQLLVKTLQEEGLSKEDIMIEVSFSLINDGYRLRDLKDDIKIEEETPGTKEELYTAWKNAEGACLEAFPEYEELIKKKFRREHE